MPKRYGITACALLIIPIFVAGCSGRSLTAEDRARVEGLRQEFALLQQEGSPSLMERKDGTLYRVIRVLSPQSVVLGRIYPRGVEMESEFYLFHDWPLADTTRIIKSTDPDYTEKALQYLAGQQPQ